MLILKTLRINHTLHKNAISQNCNPSLSTMLRHSVLPTPLPPSLRLSQTLSRQRYQTLASTSPATSYTISDDDLHSKGYIIHRTHQNLNIDQLNSVFVAVGFPRRNPEKISTALENTDALVWIEDCETRRPVAFARATGDGVFNAVIWDVVVDPRFQGVGLGKAVMERLMETVLARGITNVALYSEPRVLGFYRPMGFVADPDGIQGMVYSRKNNKKK